MYYEQQSFDKDLSQLLYNFQDFIDCAKDIEKYNLLPDVKNYEDMGRYLVNETGHFDDVSVLDEYINYEKLAKDYTQKGYTYNGNFTKSGFLFNIISVSL